jgi:hypothetical protein
MRLHVNRPAIELGRHKPTASKNRIRNHRATQSGNRMPKHGHILPRHGASERISIGTWRRPAGSNSAPDKYVYAYN